MSGLSLLLFGIAVVGIAYLALAAAMVALAARSGTDGSRGEPAITVLKPLHGDEPGLTENLLSLLRQEYGGPVQVVCGVQSRADTAIPVVERLIAAHPDRDITLVVDACGHGTNRKVSNLINMMALARHDTIVLADSDMRVGPHYLAGLVRVLSRQGVGAVTCLYHGLASDGLWSRLTGLGIDTHFLPGVAVGIGLGIGHPCMGSTIALRRETLERIGGFEAIADELADDHVLGARVRGLGLSVAVAPFTISHVCPQASPGDLLAQELRWVRTVRQIEPAGHAGSIVAHPLAFALLALSLAPGPVTAAAVGGALLARLGLCLAVERAFGLKPHAYGLIPLRDILSFAVFAASFLGRGVSWRGHRYQVARSGALIPTTLLPTTRPGAP